MILDKYIPLTTLQSEYISAKIIANPHDFVLSDRIFLTADPDIRKYDIFSKTHSSELYLADLLLDDVAKEPYMNVRKEIDIPEYEQKPSDMTCLLNNDACGCNGFYIKYNNFIIEEKVFLNDCGYIHKDTLNPIKDAALVCKDIRTYNVFKALSVLFESAITKGSIIPNLMYLMTDFSEYAYDDLTNIKFADDFLAKKGYPIIQNYKPYGLKIFRNTALSTNSVPFFKDKDVYAPKMYLDNAKNFEFLENPILGNTVYRMGLHYAIVYGCELLYLLVNIKDESIKEAIKELFSINYRPDSFCSRFLYTYDSTGFNINPAVAACFVDNPEGRFYNFKRYYESCLGFSELRSDPLSDVNYYALPIFFARMVQNCHSYAYQVAKVKHATLLYQRCKEKGLLDKDDFVSEACEDSDGLFGMGGATGEKDDPSSELLDLSSEKFGKDTSDFDTEAEKEIGTTKKEAPKLASMDNLKRDLADSRYNFTIKYAEHKNEYKDSYDVVVKNTTLITHELTKQIKDIRTYNTGGKQGGLLVGKLDKKNLWKYKTDPHIFCNNNYKLKEMDLAFGIILDQSGSMSGSGIKDGRTVLIMMHEVLNSLGINHSIIGHTCYEGMYSCEIIKYFQFKEEDKYSLQRPYGICKAQAHSGNCDSGSLYYMQSVMKAVRNKDKIVIIFSDGEPTECTGEDLKQQVRAMERNGIHVIGVGINFDSIKEYYPDNANGRNLKEMVDIVVSILKRYVLEKKDD